MIYSGNNVTETKDDISITKCYDATGQLISITDPAGSIIYNLRSDGQPLSIVAPGNITTSFGYDNYGRQTGHEHLREFGLINMNARLYDPSLGRFLSPDPYVQAPDLSQSFNRYSYCLNNPLKYTDPSGENWISDKIGQFQDWFDKNVGSTLRNIGITSFSVGGSVSYTPGKSGANLYGGGGVGIMDHQGVVVGYSFDENKQHRWGIGTNYGDSYYFGSYEAMVQKIGYSVLEIQNWWYRTATAGSMFYDWIMGEGPITRTFNDDLISSAMKDAYKVNEARNEFFRKYEGVSNFRGASLTNFKGNFGLMGLFRAGFDPIEQFVGSCRIDITSDGNKLFFSLYNNTSFKSFFYQLGPAWERSTFSPGGNMYQYYKWSEPLKISK